MYGDCPIATKKNFAAQTKSNNTEVSGRILGIVTPVVGQIPAALRLLMRRPNRRATQTKQCDNRLSTLKQQQQVMKMSVFQTITSALRNRKPSKTSQNYRRNAKSTLSRSLRLESLERREVFDGAGLMSFHNDLPSSPLDNVVDSQGNQYVVGYLFSAADFDVDRVWADGSDFLTPVGKMDGYVAKYDTSGEFQWARRMGGDFNPATFSASFDWATDIQVADDGSVYVAGTFVRNAQFGSITLTSPYSDNYAEAFLTKLDAQGNFVWAKQFAGAGDDGVGALSLDVSGNVLFGSFDRGQASIQKFTPSGAPVWTAKVDSPVSWGATVTAIDVDAQNNVIIAGSFAGKVDFDPSSKKAYYVTGGTAPSGTVGIRNAINGYVLKLSSSGSFKQVSPILARTNLDANASVFLPSMGTDTQGNIYVGVSYKGPIDINPSGSVDTRPNVNDNQVLLKLTSNGSMVWQQSYFASNLRELKVTGDTVIVGGSYSAPLTLPGMFASVTPRGVMGDYGYPTDIYFAEFGSDGSLDWTAFLGGENSDSLQSFDITSDGAIHMLGSGNSSYLELDSDPLTPPDLTDLNPDGARRGFRMALRRS